MIEFAKRYFSLLTQDYAGINLTRINEFEEFYTKQILDSILPLEQSQIFKNSINKTGLHIDVGFGGGFPILPLAKLYPDIRFIGVETRAKKVKVVSEIAQKLGITNVVLVHERVENLQIDMAATISFKAVGKVYDFLSKLNLLQKNQIFFYKGPNFYQIESEQIKMTQTDWDLIEESEIKIEGVEKRYLIGFENKNVPCGTNNKSINNLVKLSQLL